jgi:O-antigen ligase
VSDKLFVQAQASLQCVSKDSHDEWGGTKSSEIIDVFLPMYRRSINTLLKIGGVIILLFVLLFPSGGWPLSFKFIGSALREITTVFRDAETQWMVFLCLGIYVAAFLFLRLRWDKSLAPRNNDAESGAHGVTRPTFWLASALFIGAINYATNYSPSLPAMILLASVTIGQGVAVWSALEVRSQKSEVRINVTSVIVIVFVILLTLASVCNDDVGPSYAYRSHARWPGPWDNPNIFGLLMGTGVAIATGLGIRRWRMEDAGSKARSGVWHLASGKVIVSRVLGLASWKLVFVGLCFLAAGLMGRGLLNSYSRGAWVATGCGLAFLIGSWIWRLGDGGNQSSNLSTINNQQSTKARWFQKNWLPLAVILMAIAAICFWHFRQTDWHPARRALSVVNSADFSSCNRVAAWVGDLQMMAEHPWLGMGWNQSEPLYEHYYLPNKLNESAAIQMNDYLMLGATLGIPALFCFAMYLGLSLIIKSEIRNKKSEISEADWLQATCRAGAIVLLVGFWFDGGLFKLPTAATFWILLELGAVQADK